MTAAVIKGTDGMTLIARPKSYTRQNGETESEEWRGPRDKAVILYNESKSNTNIDSVSFDDTPGAAVASVILTRVDQALEQNEEENAIWEVDATEVFRDLRTHPYIVLRSGAIMTELQLADEKIKSGTAYSAGDYALTEVVIRYFALRRYGVEGYYQSVLVLRKTMTVSSRSDVEAAYENVNRVVSLNSIDPPRNLLGPLGELPNITAYSSFANPGSPTLETGDWEWLKKTPKVRSIAGSRRFEISNEWWGADQWSTVFYGGTWDPAGS